MKQRHLRNQPYPEFNHIRSKYFHKNWKFLFEQFRLLKKQWGFIKKVKIIWANGQRLSTELPKNDLQKMATTICPFTGLKPSQCYFIILVVKLLMLDNLALPFWKCNFNCASLTEAYFSFGFLNYCIWLKRAR